MPNNIRTYLYCFDDHRVFTEEIRKKFDDPARYIIHSFQTREELIGSLKSEKENRSCKIAIIGVHDSGEQADLTNQLTGEIRKTDPRTGIILLCPPDKTEDIKKNLKFNIDAYIPRNSNFILRVHNMVKKLFSEHNIRIHRKRRNRSLIVLSLFLLVTIILAFFVRFRFPEFF